jgi:hypothetical protein
MRIVLSTIYKEKFYLKIKIAIIIRFAETKLVEVLRVIDSDRRVNYSQLV